MKNTTRLVVTLPGNVRTTVQTTLEDRLAFETALRKNRSWGTLNDNSMKLLPYLAWNALRRKGETTLTWAEFTSGDTAALAVEPEPDPEDGDEDDDLEVEGVGKDTPTEPSTSSPSSSPETTAAPLGSGEATPAHA